MSQSQKYPDETKVYTSDQAIVGLDRQIPLLDGSLHQYVYLDNAASTPAFYGVQRKVNEFLEWYSSAHRGAGFKSLLVTHAYEQSHDVIAKFVGADPEIHVVIFGKNTTEAINKLVNRMQLKPNDVIICTLMEHHSNDLPWRDHAQIEYVKLNEDGSLDMNDLKQKLDRFGGRVKMVTTTGASNVTGFIPPIHEIARLTHEVGAKIFVDCAQLAGHRKIDMCCDDPQYNIDFVALSAHKMYAPFGTGALIGLKSFFQQGSPDYKGGGTIELVTLDEIHWTEPPYRDEAGSPNVVGAIALAASSRILSQIGMEAVTAHEMELTKYTLHQLNRIKGVKVYNSNDPDQLHDRLGVIAFEVEDVHHAKVAAILAFEGGIGVRNGCFCAHPYVLQLLGISNNEYQAYRRQVLRHDRSQLPGLVRISFGCYNTLDEVDHFIGWLQRIIDEDYQGDYVMDESTGSYLPRNFDHESFDEYFTL